MKNSREIPLEHGGYYHIYNRGNNGEILFHSSDNYCHFLRLYEKYIDPVADTYAWCLMGNHFHLLMRIKEEGEVGYLVDLNASGSSDSGRFKWGTVNNLPASVGPGSVIGLSRPGSVMGMKKPIPHRMFSHLFNSYTKYLNLKIGLFDKRCEREER